jgi:hypothetical protein
MRMRSVTLLAVGLMSIGAWTQDSARGQASVEPPVSLVPQTASPSRANTGNSRIPPAADYDGFSAADETDTPSQVTPPVRSRARGGSDSYPDASSLDHEDEALKRKLTICKNCK